MNAVRVLFAIGSWKMQGGRCRMRRSADASTRRGADAGGACVAPVGSTIDPKISKTAGHNFDVMSAGVFNPVEIKSKEGGTLLRMNANIVQAALQRRVYNIQNITLHAGWLKSFHLEEGLAFRSKIAGFVQIWKSLFLGQIPQGAIWSSTVATLC